MAGLSRLIAKELNRALGITDNPKYNPLFKDAGEDLADVADPSDPTVARFYSPLESAIDEAPIGKEGTRGENIEAFVRKRAPKVTQAEMQYRGLGLEPSELYTAESAKEGLKGLDVKAVKRDGRYRMSQRQDSLIDKEVDYTELSLEADDDLGFMTHFGSSNVAHARYSVRESYLDKKNYILIEELQSDPIQNVVEDLSKFKNKKRSELDVSLGYNYDDIEWLIETEGIGYPDTAISKVKSYIDDVVIPTHLDTKLTKEERKDIFKKAAKERNVPEDLVFGDSGSISNVTFNILSKEFEDIPDEELGRITDSMHNRVGTYIGNLKAATNKKDLPVTSITDTIRMSLQAIISDAKSKGINEIVLPPVEKLAERRFTGSEIDEKIAKGSAFHNTYVAAYNKVLKQLKAELGNQIKVGKKDLIYRTTFKDAVDKKQGRLLDISNLTIDPAKVKLRFNKGGLVQRPD